MMETIRLTSYSHGAGCGCKISPSVLDTIISGTSTGPEFTKLIVGNQTKDDAAVFDLGDGRALISTTDFFMPIVDDPYIFGRIAAANAISDVYAMGGEPILAIAILGWPVDKLSPEIATRVVDGGKSMCTEAGIPLAGGHSIDCPEPVFGLSVNGLVEKGNLKRNDAAKIGDILFLTKKIGVGILTTAEKKGLLRPEHGSIASEQMQSLNRIGKTLGAFPSVHAMTDVTGFGVLGHLKEMADGSGLTAELWHDAVQPIVEELEYYISVNAVPGGTKRNLDSYGGAVEIHRQQGDMERVGKFLADPQTSGGLLVSVDSSSVDEIIDLFASHGLVEHLAPVGRMIGRRDHSILVS